MNDKETNKEVKQIKEETLNDYENLDKSNSRDLIIELIFFLLVIAFLLMFLFRL